MNLLSLLFPPRCPFCRSLLAPGEEQLCGSCREYLPWTGANQRQNGSYFSVCVSPLYYRNGARSGLLRFKFGRKKSGVPCFSRLMADCASERLSGQFELITWVPLSRKGQRKRGFCQSELLAAGISELLGVPCVSLLRKQRHTPTQSGIHDPASRQANVSGAFTLQRDASPDGKQILLVDDVFTTGATLSECSRVLLMGGAERVVCVTLCCASSMKE